MFFLLCEPGGPDKFPSLPIPAFLLADGVLSQITIGYVGSATHSASMQGAAVAVRELKARLTLVLSKRSSPSDRSLASARAWPFANWAVRSPSEWASPSSRCRACSTLASSRTSGALCVLTYAHRFLMHTPDDPMTTLLQLLSDGHPHPKNKATLVTLSVCWFPMSLQMGQGE